MSLQTEYLEEVVREILDLDAMRRQCMDEINKRYKKLDSVGFATVTCRKMVGKVASVDHFAFRDADGAELDLWKLYTDTMGEVLAEKVAKSDQTDLEVAIAEAEARGEGPPPAPKKGDVLVETDGKLVPEKVEPDIGGDDPFAGHGLSASSGEKSTSPDSGQDSNELPSHVQPHPNGDVGETVKAAAAAEKTATAAAEMEFVDPETGEVYENADELVEAMRARLQAEASQGETIPRSDPEKGEFVDPHDGQIYGSKEELSAARELRSKLRKAQADDAQREISKGDDHHRGDGGPGDMPDFLKRAQPEPEPADDDMGEEITL